MFGRSSARRKETPEWTGAPADGAGVDMTSEMARLAAALGPLAYAQAPGHGRVLQFAAARRGEGTSTVAREFARFASTQLRRPVWLVDLDLAGSPQYAAMMQNPDRFGRVGSAAGASPDGSCFFTVQPQARDAQGQFVPPARYLVAHPVGGPNLWVTRFRRELLAPGQHAHLVPSQTWWDVMRRHADLIVVDSPSAELSQAAAMLAPSCDATVLVVAADAGESRPPALLKSAITASGGKVAGLFFNRARMEPSTLVKAILP